MTKSNQKGFTLAEIMIAVAIIAILAGVSFISVANYFRSMAQLEYDGYAKEIFVAAQNHLTMAEGQGFLGINNFGTVENREKEGTTPSDNGQGKSDTVFYFIKSGGSYDNTSMLGLMLPFGSVDDTIRLGGDYVIHYQLNPAKVLDVFYSDPKNERFYYTMGDVSSLMAYAGEENKGTRKDIGGKVLGWYGDEEFQALAHVTLENPTLELVNDAILYAKVENLSDANKGATARLFIEGVASGAKRYFDLGNSIDSSVGEYGIVLDDITSPKNHFSQVMKLGSGKEGDLDFIPGENIKVHVEVFRNDTPSNIAKSATKTTNSLFADSIMVEADADTNTNESTSYIEVSIGNMRHLANLSAAISGMQEPTNPDELPVEGTTDSENQMIKAVQIDDFEWPDFLETVSTLNSKIPNTGSTNEYGKKVYSNSGTPNTSENCWWPVDVSYMIQYSGENHWIKGVKTDSTPTGGESAGIGLFGSVGLDGKESSIANLELLDFKIETTKGNAGTLAGNLISTSVENVLAHSSITESAPDSGNVETGTDAITVITDAGAAGGLIGSMTGGEIKYSAAAVSVKSNDGDAGGLIGKVSATANSNTGTGNGVTIEGCYSGGHTVNGAYKKDSYNVDGTRNVGGLAGDAGSAVIRYSYSTCSAKGQLVGGLIGTGTGSVNNSYSTGLVSGQTRGAFAGNSGTITGSHYIEIINEETESDGGYLYLGPVNGENATGASGIEAIDRDVASYNAFLTDISGETAADAFPYDEMLKQYYNNKYAYKTVSLLGARIPSKQDEFGEDIIYYVEDHYGDWPAPEIYVINQ